MKKFFLLLGVFSGAAFGQSPTWPAPNQPPSMRYTAAREQVEYGENTTNHFWYGVRHQGLWGSVRDDRKSARIKLNSNLAAMVGANSSLFNKVQVETYYENPGILYGLLGYEIPVYSPVTFFVASVHRPGGDQNFFGGPIFYFDAHNIQVFYYGKQVTGSTVKQSVAIRQTLRFEPCWFLTEAVWRDTHDTTYSPWGYGIGIGFRHFYAKAQVSPYWDGFRQRRTSIELGVDL